MSHNRSHHDFVVDSVHQYNAKNPSVRLILSVPYDTTDESSNDLSLVVSNEEKEIAEGGGKTTEQSVLDFLLTQVLVDEKLYNAMFATRGAEAQRILDLLQQLLDSPGVGDATRRAIVPALLRLSARSGLYPQPLVVDDVQCTSLPVTKGGSSDIYKGEYHCREVCIKVIRQSGPPHPNRRIRVSPKISRRLTHLIRLRYRYSHGKLLSGVGSGIRMSYHFSAFINPVPAFINLVITIMELGSYRPGWRYLGSFPDAPRFPLVHDVVNGLRYLHQNNVVHSDLKGANILITDSGLACITDFGLSSIMYADSTSTQVGGTTRWVAPELLDGGNTGLMRPTYASDMYALASVMFEILTRRVPFYEIHSDALVVRNVIQGTHPDRPEPQMAPELTDDIWRIMLYCWSNTPSDRPMVNLVRTRLLENAPGPSRVESGETVDIDPMPSQVQSGGVAGYLDERHVPLSQSDLAFLRNVIVNEA
ncbi:kinase-like protein [Macrolepiota fuliginosa MF-IS2]|uniref:Kinase-like protein n=1 Tax=Macrolepiota fuliginosa MF-IS2 TaxID=1400762 RepID=A0A9P6C4A2_9AGAR|nr:kinase-like protein [Macrolepiota fuliginosa MF-IS2]